MESPGCVFCRTASEQETYQKTVCPFGNRNLCSGLPADACEYENTARLLSGVCIGRNRKRIYVGNAVGHGTGCVRSCDYMTGRARAVFPVAFIAAVVSIGAVWPVL